MQQKKEVEMAINRKAPVMRTRVIRVDPFAQKPDRLLKDFFSPQEAYNLADKRNRGRTGPMDDVVYVYDDQGNFLHGDEVSGFGTSA